MFAARKIRWFHFVYSVDVANFNNLHLLLVVLPRSGLAQTIIQKWLRRFIHYIWCHWTWIQRLRQDICCNNAATQCCCYLYRSKQYEHNSTNKILIIIEMRYFMMIQRMWYAFYSCHKVTNIDIAVHYISLKKEMCCANIQVAVAAVYPALHMMYFILI